MGVLALCGLLTCSVAQASAASIYWAGNSSVGTQEIDDATGVLSGSPNNAVSTGCNGDWSWSANSTMYYSRSNSDICQMRLDGTGSSSTLVATGCGGLGVGGIYATDLYVYWACMNTSRLGRVDVAGTNPILNFTATPAGPNDSYTTAIAAGDDWLYVGNTGVYSCMQRYHIDGSGVDPNFSLCVGDVRSIDVDGRHVYWAINNGTTIGRAKLNGTGSNASWLSSGSDTFGVTVTGSSIYWARRSGGGAIGRADLSGANANSSLITGAGISSSNEHAQLKVVGGTAKLLPLPSPINTVAPAITGTPKVDVVLSAGTGTWMNPPADASGYTYLWQVSPNGESGWVTGAGTGTATASYYPAAAEYAQFLRVKVTATNDGGATVGYSMATNAVLPVAPVSSVTPQLTGTVQVGETLSVDTGSWASQQQPTAYAYAWQVSASGAPDTWEPALGDGADSATYDVDMTDDNKYLRAQVTATNDGGSNVATAYTQTLVDILPPSPTEVPAITGTVTIGSTLTASTGTWDFATGYAYAWESSVDGSTWQTAPGTGAATNTYIVAAADAGRYLRVRVTGTNRVDSQESTSASSIRVPTPAAPVAPVVTPVAEPSPETPQVFSPAPGITVGETRGEANLAAAVPAAGADLLRGANIWVRSTSKVEYVPDALPAGLKVVNGKLVATVPGTYKVQVKVKRANGTTKLRTIKIKVG
ncbi:MAG: hypothetical protein WCN97_00840 [Thermoleophilia bacterium]